MSSSRAFDARHRLVRGDHRFVRPRSRHAGRLRPSSTSISSLQLRQPVDDSRDAVAERGVEHERLGVGVVEQVPQLLVEVAVVDVDRHAADLERGVLGLEVLVAVVEVEADLRVRAEAGGDQRRGQAGRPIVVLAPTCGVSSPCTTAAIVGIASAIDSQTVAKCISIRLRVGEPPVRTRHGRPSLARLQTNAEREQTSASTRGRASVVAVLLLALFALTSSIATGSAAAVAEATVPPIGFGDAAEPDDLSPVVAAAAAGAVRSRYVDIVTSDLLVALAMPDVTIELFDDVEVPFGATGQVTTGQEGGVTWSATTPDSLATLTFADDGVHGTISVGANRYSIVPTSGTTHLVFEEGRSLPNETESIEPPPALMNDVADGSSVSQPLDPGPAAAADGAPVIRVLTVYDDGARTYFGGDAGAVAALAATIDEVNAAYARSGINAVMESAAIEHVAYAGTGGSASVELNRITGKTDGHLDAVHARRDALAADLVVLVVPMDSGTCGQAWLLTPPVSASDAAFGFSVVRPDCARVNLTFAHETGHNLGAGHGPADPGYANGYINIAGDYRTIMAYDDPACPAGSCQRVAYFSSPTVRYNGQPTGSATQNDARVVSEFAPAVSAFRDRSAIVSLSPARLLDSRSPGGRRWMVSWLVVVSRGAGSVTEVQVTGRGGVPVGAAAAVLNVTVVQARAGGYATVFPCGESMPNASNLNYVAGQTVPNAVVAKVGVGGKVCVFSEVPIDLIVDVNGYVPVGFAGAVRCRRRGCWIRVRRVRRRWMVSWLVVVSVVRGR